MRSDAIAALVAFVVAYAAAVPFMNTTLIVGPVARPGTAPTWPTSSTSWLRRLYGGYRLMRQRTAAVPATAAETPVQGVGA